MIQKKNKVHFLEKKYFHVYSLTLSTLLNTCFQNKTIFWVNLPVKKNQTFFLVVINYLVNIDRIFSSNKH